MQPDEFKELRAQADDIAQTDVKVGRFLQSLVYHLGHAHGLDAAEEDAKAEKQSKAAEEKSPKASTKKEG
jgi:hypothetical protein